MKSNTLERGTRSDARRVVGRIIGEASRVAFDTASLRKVRQKWSRELRHEDGDYVLNVARELIAGGSHSDRMLGFELLLSHEPAFKLLDEGLVNAFAEGLADWGSIDLFGVTIAGPAWRMRIISDSAVAAWSRSPDRWRRRLALVATVPLNARSRGGTGDARRTLAVCRRLLADRDPMVVKAMSWALRELAKREPQVVSEFVAREQARLPALVRREVGNKIRTGLKSGRVRRTSKE
ncbi:MAG TPA: DNA alkylation repair protein [Gemmatimonadaceae bacterium]|nr:DNA alkylation repair protein [Gemmatimonadaceae bacterium]